MARKPLDPALRQYLDALPGYPSAPNQTVLEKAVAARDLMPNALKKRESIPGLPNSVTVRDVSITASLQGRIFTPSKNSGATMVYFHGGGWVVGSVATHEPFCRLLAEKSGIIIMSVEYRLAPEHPFPAGAEDAITAVGWAKAHATEWGGDPKRIAVGGDSAGANLAAVAGNHFGPELAAQLLLFPVTDPLNETYGSYQDNGKGYGLETPTMLWFRDTYARGAAPHDARLSPFREAKLPKLPPTFVSTAEYDPLRDDGMAYAEKLRAAGTKVTHAHSPDMHHNFSVHPGTVVRFPQSVAALDEMASWLRQTLG